jgi:hypothetical protein
LWRELKMAVKKINFSGHSILKIDILKKHGVIVNKELIEGIINRPSKTEVGYKNRKIAQGNLDAEHVLRIIYEESANEVLIITLYPGRKDRYEKN